MKGNWQRSNDLLTSLKTFNQYTNVNEIKEQLSENVKLTSLKCYLIYYGNEFDSFNFSSLCKKFNLEESQTRKIINNVKFINYSKLLIDVTRT